MPINKSNIKPFACRVTRINGTRNKSITSNLARKGLNIVSIMVLIGLSTFCLIPIDSTSATTPLYFSVDSDPSMSITLQNASNVDLTNNSSTLNITPTNDGTFGKQDINILVGTNNRSGYTLFMVADTTTSLEGSSNVDIEAIPTKSNGYTENEFISSSDTLNKWGYMIKSTRLTSGTDYVPNYNPMKTTNIKINSYNTNTAEPDRTTINFATKLNNAIPSGSYGSTINFIATANPVTYTINYNKGNATNAVAGIPSSVTNTSDSAVTISNTTPTRTAGDVAATFNGWCDKNPTFVNGTETCPGNTYQPSSELPFSVISVNETTTLYAMWTVASGQAATTAMQNLTCSNTYNNAAQVYDARDLKVYWVQKLADGKCWMTQNLDFDISSNETYTHYNTDLGYTDYNLNEIWTPIAMANTSNNINNYSVINYNKNTNFFPNWNHSINEPTSADPGEYYARMSTPYRTKDACEAANNPTICSHIKVGNFYNFAASNATNDVNKTVGTIKKQEDSSINPDTYVVSNSDIYFIMPNSICPAGWKLPTGLTNANINDASTTHSELNYLFNQYNATLKPESGTSGTEWTNTGYNFAYNTLYLALAGVAWTDLDVVGRAGYLWYNTISTDSNGYLADFYESGITTASYSRGNGNNVRCVIRNQ